MNTNTNVEEKAQFIRDMVILNQIEFTVQDIAFIIESYANEKVYEAIREHKRMDRIQVAYQ
jgi:hypothetical protein